MPTLVFHLDDGSVFTHSLEEGTTTIGRHPDSVVVLEFPSVSGHHAVIELGDGGCFVTDQKSSNGTRVNGVEIEEARLSEGDRLAFGDVQAVYYQGEAPALLAEAEEIRVPMPQVAPVVEAAPPMPQRNYRTPAPPRNRAVRVNSYPDTSGSGCATAAIVIALFVAAFLAGLYLRHHKETGGGNFFSDLLNRVGGNLPKIKIEKTVEQKEP
jgi:pSer/pThr/pTyr-binding forkhead associated (FHA) protein